MSVGRLLCALGLVAGCGGTSLPDTPPPVALPEVAIEAVAVPPRRMPSTFERVCPLDQSPTPAIVRTAGPPGALRAVLRDRPQGHVLTQSIRADLVDSASRLRSLTFPDTIEFTTLPPGTYRLRVGRIGYAMRIDTIAMPPDSGLHIEMSLRWTANDECGFDEVEILPRKPE